MKGPFHKSYVLTMGFMVALTIVVSAAMIWLAVEPPPKPQTVEAQAKDEKTCLGDAMFQAAMDRIHELDRQEKARKQANPDTAFFGKIAFRTLENRSGGRVIGTLTAPGEAIVFHDGSPFGVRSALPAGSILSGIAVFNPDEVGGKNLLILNDAKFPDGTDHHIRASLKVTNGQLDL